MPKSLLSSADEDALVRDHLPVVGYLVAELAGRLPRHVSRDDLVSAGNAALVAAVRSYQPERGPFGSYARTRIRGALLDELRRMDWAARSVRAEVRRRDRVVDELTCQLGRRPEPAEVAAALGISVRDLDGVDDDVHRSVVLSYQHVAETRDVAAELPDGAPTPEQVILERERQAYLLAAVECLPDRLRRVVEGYFFEDLPMAALSAELGVSESRISQMRAEAVALMREGIAAQLEAGAGAREPRRDGAAARRRAAYYAAVAAHADYRTRVSVPAPRTASSGREKFRGSAQEEVAAAE